ncbi:hypothetical protein LY13_001232 [Prauserella aidingensis]|uniref:septum formation initiator n=1 Tax=Prauserella aidingensis TaxID=387890 RepID=UPI0020A295FF|nr:septum formation initiator [Prauserella aidingensis]MCP2252489.1 hypothetical protein [Prauserella aidingensis]
MTAPARPRTQPVERPRQTPRRSARQAPTSAPETGSPRRRSSAAERAYARRAQRAETLQRQTERRETPEPRRLRIRIGWPTSRASFVLMLMALMAVGVATTLWLSTQAISDSYRLEQLRQNNAALLERSEELQRAVASGEAPARLAERARDLGMVPGGNPARLVVGDDGTVRVVGESERASAPAPQQSSTGRPGGAQGDGAQGDRAQSDGAQGDGAESRDRQAGDAQEDRAQQRDSQAGDDTRGDRGNDGDGGRGGDTGTTGDGDRPADSAAAETAD